MKLRLFSIITLSFICITSILTSCNQNNPQPNTNTNTASPTWKIKFTINGVTHRAEGNSLNENSNFCYALISNPWIITAKIADKTDASYISGDNGYIQLMLTNPSQGVNPISNCNIGGSWITDAIDHPYNGYSLTLNGPMVPNSNGPRLPINLTSLGSAGNGGYNNSQPVKGNYSGTLYFPSSLSPVSGFDTPVTINLEFEALRP
jgi:hypothetical protein